MIAAVGSKCELAKAGGLAVLDCVLIPTVLFCILLVTAADRPSRTQGIIAWFLVVVVTALVVALIAMIVLIVRRVAFADRTRRFANPS